jgi:hypothetical protein
MLQNQNHIWIANLTQIKYLNELNKQKKSNKYSFLLNPNITKSNIDWAYWNNYKISNQQMNWNKYSNYVK